MADNMTTPGGHLVDAAAAAAAAHGQPMVRAEMAPAPGKREARLSRAIKVAWIKNIVIKRGPTSLSTWRTRSSFRLKEGDQWN